MRLVTLIDTHSLELLWKMDQLVAETKTWKHTTFTRDGHLCPSAGFEPAIPTRERPQTHALDTAATGLGSLISMP